MMRVVKLRCFAQLMHRPQDSLWISAVKTRSNFLCLEAVYRTDASCVSLFPYCLGKVHVVQRSVADRNLICRREDFLAQNRALKKK